MEYETPIMNVISFQKTNVVTASGGLVEGDDSSHGDDF